MKVKRKVTYSLVSEPPNPGDVVTTTMVHTGRSSYGSYGPMTTPYIYLATVVVDETILWIMRRLSDGKVTTLEPEDFLRPVPDLKTEIEVTSHPGVTVDIELRK
jgi:hypothetical protein